MVDATSTSADVLLTGGAVTTMDATRRTAEALAIRDGRVLAVGLARDLQIGRAHV